MNIPKSPSRHLPPRPSRFPQVVPAFQKFSRVKKLFLWSKSEQLYVPVATLFLVWQDDNKCDLVAWNHLQVPQHYKQLILTSEIKSAMFKSAILLSALCAQVAFALYVVEIKNTSGSQAFTFKANDNYRYCICVRNTQTGSIEGKNGGNIKIFSSSDCTGSFQTVDPSQKVTNTQWVNSFSYGEPDISSAGPGGHCPNYYVSPR
ncbi:unnamed protein product [Mortierella alpina]